MTIRLPQLLALAAGLAGCRAQPASTAPAVVLDPSQPAPGTAADDLPLLRQKAAMGLVDVVRAELVPRLQHAPKTGPDPGRDALRDLAREQLALGQPDQALGSVRRALAAHEDRLAVFEDQLLAVDILIAVGQPVEAVIAAGKLYDDAIEHVGPATLAHAEALAAAATATFMSGDRDASLTFFTDARKIWDDLQAARVDLDLPLSARLQRRLRELDAAHQADPS